MSLAVAAPLLRGESEEEEEAPAPAAPAVAPGAAAPLIPQALAQPTLEGAVPAAPATAAAAPMAAPGDEVEEPEEPAPAVRPAPLLAAPLPVVTPRVVIQPVVIVPPVVVSQPVVVAPGSGKRRSKKSKLIDVPAEMAFDPVKRLPVKERKKKKKHAQKDASLLSRDDIQFALTPAPEPVAPEEEVEVPERAVANIPAAPLLFPSALPTPFIDFSALEIQKMDPIESFSFEGKLGVAAADEDEKRGEPETWEEEPPIEGEYGRLMKIADIPIIPRFAFIRKGATLNRYYFVRQADTPQSVAQLLYADKTMGNDLVRWNSLPWNPGQAIFYWSPKQNLDNRVRSYYEEAGTITTDVKMHSGECLQMLAQRLLKDKLSWREIAQVNGLDDRDFCDSGHRLKVHGNFLAEADAPAAAGVVPARKPASAALPATPNAPVNLEATRVPEAAAPATPAVTATGAAPAGLALSPVNSAPAALLPPAPVVATPPGFIIPEAKIAAEPSHAPSLFAPTAAAEEEEVRAPASAAPAPVVGPPMIKGPGELLPAPVSASQPAPKP